MSVRKWIGGAGNQIKNTVLAHIAWRVGFNKFWRGRLDRSSGPDDEYYEMNLMKNMVLDHRAWHVGSKMA